MTKTKGIVALALVFTLALAVNGWVTWHDHGSLSGFVHAESAQRVTTIGERCETTEHQAKVLHNNLPPAHRSEARWFHTSYARCKRSLAKVEARAGVTYQPPK